MDCEDLQIADLEKNSPPSRVNPIYEGHPRNAKPETRNSSEPGYQPVMLNSPRRGITKIATGFNPWYKRYSRYPRGRISPAPGESPRGTRNAKRETIGSFAVTCVERWLPSAVEISRSMQLFSLSRTHMIPSEEV